MIEEAIPILRERDLRGYKKCPSCFALMGIKDKRAYCSRYCSNVGKRIAVAGRKKELK